MRSIRNAQWRAIWAAAALGTALVGCGEQTAAVEGDRIEAPQPGDEASAGSGGWLSNLTGGAESRAVTLAAGERIEVQTTNTLSTKSTQSGETFYGHLAKALTVDGAVVAPAGSQVMGRVSSSDPGGRVKGVASLAVVLTEIRTPEGATIPIETRAYVTEAKKTHTKDAQKIGVGAGVGAAIGAVAGGGGGALKGAGVGAGAGTGAVLATRGAPAVIPAESVIWFSLVNDVTVTL